MIVKLRLMFDLYADIRPLKAYPNVKVAHPDIDMIFVRENTEDVYRGLEFTIGNDTTLCMRVITRDACKRIAKKAFEIVTPKKRQKESHCHPQSQRHAHNRRLIRKRLPRNRKTVSRHQIQRTHMLTQHPCD